MVYYSVGVKGSGKTHEFLACLPKDVSDRLARRIGRQDRISLMKSIGLHRLCSGIGI